MDCLSLKKDLYKAMVKASKLQLHGVLDFVGEHNSCDREFLAALGAPIVFPNVAKIVSDDIFSPIIKSDWLACCTSLDEDELFSNSGYGVVPRLGTLGELFKAQGIVQLDQRLIDLCFSENITDVTGMLGPLGKLSTVSLVEREADDKRLVFDLIGGEKV
jgi:hypothetical protein